MRRALFSILLLFLAAPARADDLAAARADYAAGRYQAAAEAGEALGDLDGLLLASQALMADCISGTSPDRRAAIERAMRHSTAALRKEPSSVRARLQLALGLGLKGRRAGLMEAARHRYAQRGRTLIEEALALDPNDAWAHALLGGWHLEVVRRGGRAGASLMGASVAKGSAAFDKALALGGPDPVVGLLYAVALLELDPKSNAEKAARVLAAAAAAQPADAFEAQMRDEARRLAAVLAARGAQAAADVIAARSS